jgi:transcriptional regulator with XRE-family HTH domain
MVIDKNKTIGDKINELLRLRDLNRADLARLTDISTGHLSDICNNKKTSVTIDTLRRIAEALQIHPAYFLEDHALGPADILPHYSDEQRKFLLSQKSLPWVKLSQEAYEKGLSPEKIREIIRIMSE